MVQLFFLCLNLLAQSLLLFYLSIPEEIEEGSDVANLYRFDLECEQPKETYYATELIQSRIKLNLSEVSL